MQDTQNPEHIRLLSLLKKLNAPTQLLHQAEQNPEASGTLLSSLTMYLSQRKDQQIDLRHVDMDLTHMCELNDPDKCNDREVPNIHNTEESSVNTGLCGSFMEARSFQVPCSAENRHTTTTQPTVLVESARRAPIQPIHHGVPDLYEVPTFNPFGSASLRPLASKDVSRRKNTIKQLLGNESNYTMWEMQGQYLKHRAGDEVKQTVDPKAIMPLEKPLSTMLSVDSTTDSRYDEWEEDRGEDSEETIYSDSEGDIGVVRHNDDGDEDEPATYVTFIKRALRGLGGQGTKREIARWMERDPDCKKFLKDRHGSWKNTMAGCLSNNAAFFHLPSSPVSSDSPRKKRGFVWCLREDLALKLKKRAKLMGDDRLKRRDSDSDNSDSEYELHEEPVRVRHDHTPKLPHDPPKRIHQQPHPINPPSPVHPHSSGHSMTPLRRYVVEAIVKHAGKADIHQICQHIIQRMYPSTEAHPTEAQIAKKIGGAIARNPLFSKLETYNEFTNKSAHVWTLSTPLSKEDESEMLHDIATMDHSGEPAQVVQGEGDCDAMDTTDSVAPAEVPHSVEPPKSPSLSSSQPVDQAPNQTTPSNEKLKYEEIWKRVRDYKTPTGRELALPFLDLPSQDEFPEYYTTIAKPIDMTYIWRNIKKGNYRGRPWRLVADFDRLFTNCRTFNPATSQLHKDATSLQSVFVKEFEERFGPIAELPPPKRAIAPISPLKALAASDSKKGIPIRVLTGTKRRLAI